MRHSVIWPVLALGSIAVSALPVGRVALGSPIAKQETLTEAVTGVYAAINTGDPDRLISYLADGGYSEFTEDGQWLRIDAAFIRRVLAPGFRANFRVTDLTIRPFNEAPDVALVTGYRVGGAISPSAPAPETKIALSMVWVRQAGSWHLAHVHLSPAERSGARR